MAKLPPHMKIARAALRKAITLKTWKNEGVTMRANWFNITDAGEDRRVSGAAGWSGGWVKVGGLSSKAYIQQVVVHELAHTCLKRAGLCDNHGPNFCGLMKAASCEFFGLTDADVVPLWRASKEVYKKRGWLHAYQLDYVFASVMDQRYGEERKPAFCHGSTFIETLSEALDKEAA
jgi:hypothetical protein